MFHEEAQDDVVDNWTHQGAPVLSPAQIQEWRLAAKKFNAEKKKKKNPGSKRIASRLLDEIADGTIPDPTQYMLFMRYMTLVNQGQVAYGGPHRVKNVVREVMLRSSKDKDFYRVANALYEEIFSPR